MQGGGVRIEPAEVEVVDGLYIVVDAAVVAVAGPVLFQAVGQLDHLGDLVHHVAVVCQAQRLIVQVLNST
jgi:hypothetical protein